MHKPKKKEEMTEDEKSRNIITAVCGYYSPAKRRRGHNLIRIFSVIKREASRLYETASRDKSRINVSLNSNDVASHQDERLRSSSGCAAFHFVAILNARFIA